MTIFTIGTTVNKRSGYQFPGTVIARFQTLEGRTRYVVEMLVWSKDLQVYIASGLLHIFSGDQLVEVNL